MGFIYIIHNDINDKKYIGKTSHTVEYRWNLHKRDYRYFKYPLYNALTKHGVDHFWAETLEECDDSVLSEREQYYIEKYGTYSHGYNATLGGEGNRKYDYDEILRLWRDGYTIKSISRKVGAHPDVIGKILGDFGVSKKERSSSCGGSNRKLVGQYDLEGNLIAVYPSASEAARQTNNSQPNISSCCRKEKWSKTCGGFKWEYVENLYNEDEKDEILRQYRKVL